MGTFPRLRLWSFANVDAVSLGRKHPCIFHPHLHLQVLLFYMRTSQWMPSRGMPIIARLRWSFRKMNPLSRQSHRTV